MENNCRAIQKEKSVYNPWRKTTYLFDCLEEQRTRLKNMTFFAPLYQKLPLWRSLRKLKVQADGPNSGQASSPFYLLLFDPQRRIFLGILVNNCHDIIISSIPTNWLPKVIQFPVWAWNFQESWAGMANGKSFPVACSSIHKVSADSPHLDKVRKV